MKPDQISKIKQVLTKKEAELLIEIFEYLKKNDCITENIILDFAFMLRFLNETDIIRLQHIAWKLRCYLADIFVFSEYSPFGLN